MEYCRTDRFSMGSIVRSMGYKVLHRPVELAGLHGTWHSNSLLKRCWNLSVTIQKGMQSRTWLQCCRLKKGVVYVIARLGNQNGNPESADRNADVKCEAKNPLIQYR